MDSLDLERNVTVLDNAYGFIEIGKIIFDLTTFHIFLPISVSEEREITVEIETRSTQMNNSIPIFLRYDAI